MKRLPQTFGCPLELTLTLLGGKWKAVILARLKDGPLRYGELRRMTPALSDKMLTERLRDLEAGGLVRRQAEAGAGHGSRYGLTAHGESLRPALQALYDWGEAAAPELGVSLRR